MNRKTIAITGISGYVGKTLLPFLENDSEIARLIGIDIQVDPQHRVSDKVEIHQLDVLDPKLDELLDDVDIFIHLAFQLLRLPGTSKKHAEQQNIENTQNVFEAAARQKVDKLIFTSSVVAYGIHPDNPIPLTEDSPLRPSPNIYYSRAKAALEQYLDEYEEQHPEILVTRLRPCTVIGPNADPSQMVSFTNDTAALVSGYDPPYQFLHEHDLAQAIYLAIKNDLAGIYNVAGDEPLKLSQLAQSKPGGRVISLPYGVFRFLAWLSWQTGSSVFAPEWLDLARFPLIVSNQKLKQRGWSPKFTTIEAYHDLIASQGNDRS